MAMFLIRPTGNEQVTAEFLGHIMRDEMGPCEILELVEVADNGDLYFEINAYGLYY